MAKILKRRTLRKSIKRRPQRKVRKAQAEGVIKRNIKQSAGKDDPKESPQKEMSLRETMIYQRMMNQQRAMMGLPQVPQSALDGLKHDQNDYKAKVNEMLARDKQRRKAEKERDDAQNAKDTAEANNQIEDNTNAIKKEHKRNEIKRKQEQAKGEGAIAELEHVNAELLEIEAQKKYKKIEYEQSIQQLKLKGHNNDVQNRIDALSSELFVLGNTLMILTQNNPEKIQQDEVVTKMMGKLVDSVKQLTEEFNETFIKNGEWNLIKTRKIPSEITKFQKEIARCQRQTRTFEREIHRKESELEEQYVLEDESRKLGYKEGAVKATNEILDGELKKDIVRNGQKFTPTGYREHLIKSNNDIKIAIHDEEQKQSILKQKQKNIDNLELEKEDLSNQEENLKITNNVHEQLVKDKNAKIQSLSQENANKALEVENLKTKKAEYKIYDDAIKDATLKKKALEVEALEQDIIFEQNRPNSEAMVQKSKILRDKMIAAEEVHQRIDYLNAMAVSQKKFIENKTILAARAKANTGLFDSNNINQQQTDLIAFNVSLNKEIEEQDANGIEFNKLIQKNPKLYNLTEGSFESFYTCDVKAQKSILQMFKDILSKNREGVLAYDQRNEVPYIDVYDEYWAKPEEEE